MEYEVSILNVLEDIEGWKGVYETVRVDSGK